MVKYQVVIAGQKKTKKGLSSVDVSYLTQGCFVLFKASKFIVRQNGSFIYTLKNDAQKRKC